MLVKSGGIHSTGGSSNDEEAFLISCMSPACFVISSLLEWSVIYDVDNFMIVHIRRVSFDGNLSMMHGPAIHLYFFLSYGSSTIMNCVTISFVSIYVDVLLPKYGDAGARDYAIHM